MQNIKDYPNNDFYIYSDRKLFKMSVSNSEESFENTIISFLEELKTLDGAEEIFNKYNASLEKLE